MHQIYITACVTTLIAFFLIGRLIKWKSDKTDFIIIELSNIINIPKCIIQ